MWSSPATRSALIQVNQFAWPARLWHARVAQYAWFTSGPLVIALADVGTPSNAALGGLPGHRSQRSPSVPSVSLVHLSVCQTFRPPRSLLPRRWRSICFFSDARSVGTFFIHSRARPVRREAEARLFNDFGSRRSVPSPAELAPTHCCSPRAPRRRYDPAKCPVAGVFRPCRGS